MAVVSYNTTEWNNLDGQLIKFGTDKARATRVGEYMDSASGRHVVEATIALATLPTVASANTKILDDSVTIPNGAFIEQVEVLVTKETAGATATFNLGLVGQDRVTVNSATGFLSAAAAFNAGTDLGKLTTYTLGTTGAGAFVGAKITTTGLLLASASTADFTAGVIKVRIYYSVPAAADL